MRLFYYVIDKSWIWKTWAQPKKLKTGFKSEVSFKPISACQALLYNLPIKHTVYEMWIPSTEINFQEFQQIEEAEIQKKRRLNK